MTAASKRNLCVVLRQVEGPNWCVVRRQLRGGKLSFVNRVATARPYKVACAVAIGTAEAEGLHLAIEASGAPLRRFDPVHDTQEPKT